MRTKDKENERRRREQLLTAAWKLFYQKGYQNTTMEDILAEAKCSKGRFYYYFHAKAELLNSLYELFDEKYLEAYQSISPALSSREKLQEICSFMFRFMSDHVGADLLTNLYLSQLSHSTDVDFWHMQRGYARILLGIITAGQQNGELRSDIPASEIVEDFVSMERGQLIDWCLRHGNYSLVEMGRKKLDRQLLGYQKQFDTKQSS